MNMILTECGRDVAERMWTSSWLVPCMDRLPVADVMDEVSDPIATGVPQCGLLPLTIGNFALREGAPAGTTARHSVRPMPGSLANPVASASCGGLQVWNHQMSRGSRPAWTISARVKCM